MQVTASFKHHDHSYVEKRGGAEFYSHLRGVPARAEYRKQAIDRAFERFISGEDDRRPEAEVCGLGLLVLQRALLAAEDLAGLLFALEGPDQWERLRRTNYTQLDAAFERARRQPDRVMDEAFGMLTTEQLREEGFSEEEREAMGRLRSKTAGRWRQMLDRTGRLWADYRSSAKATMHGFPFIAGPLVQGPPSAGDMAAGIRTPAGRFALGISSTLNGTEVTTDRTIVLLHRTEVDRVARDGRMVADLCEELCCFQATSIEGGYAAGLPLKLLSQLSDRDQAVISEAVERQQRD